MTEAVAIRKGKITMLRALYSGISGMKNFQTKLDVIGNNIANVNTFGFKKGRTTFSDQISQTMTGTSAPTDNKGGTNAKQIGMGAFVASIDTVATQGALQNTGRPLDLAIQGNGYFVMTDGDKSYYTRSGNFSLDIEGNVVNSDGLYLTGNGAHMIPPDAQSFSISTNGMINYVSADGTLEEAGQIQLATFPNPEGLQKSGSNLFSPSTNSGEAAVGNPEEAGAGSIKANFLEMSNVDLSEEFTEMIVAQRAFQSNTKIITTSDEILQEIMGLKR